jgi:hypothetical protein
MKNPVTYVKALRISRGQYEVGCEYEDGTYYVDGSYEDGDKAERRAKQLAKMCNCDFGVDY